MKHFRQSYGNQATRHSPKRCWKKEWLWAPLAFDAFEPFLTSLQSLTVWQMGQGRSETWTVPGRHSRVEAHRAGHAALDRWPKAHPAHPAHPRTRRTPAMLDACFRASLLGFGAARRFGMWRCCDTQERGVRSQHIHGGWQSDRCLSGTLVSKQSVAHIRTPWHALARPGTCKCRNLWFPRVSCRAWIGFGACTFLHVASSCHEVIPGGTKATIVGVDEDGDLPVFTDDGKTMVTWCSMWLQVRERQCGPCIPTSPTLQLQKSDVQTTSNWTINSFAKSSNVLLQIRWILSRSTSRGFAFWVCCQYANVIVVTQKYQAHW